MRLETKIGVLIGLGIVVVAGVYFSRARQDERDLIVSLTPPTPRTGAPTIPEPLPTVANRTPRRPARVEPSRTASPRTAESATGRPTLDRVTRQSEPTRPHVAAPTAGRTPLRAAETERPLRAADASPGPERTTSLKPGDADRRIGTPDASPGLERITPLKPAETNRQLAQTPPRTTVTPPPGEPTPSRKVGADGPAEMLIAVPPPASVAPAWPKSHTIRNGDTIAAIARDAYGDVRFVARILAANPHVRDPRRLRIGTTITLPAPDDEPAKLDQTAAAGPPKGVSLIARTAAAPPSAPRTADARPARTYTVQSGDSLYAIAEEQLGDGLRWRELLRLNRAVIGSDPDRLRPGMVLTLPPAESATPPR